ncbi:MAG: membrane protein insertion efficiency factor YidD [Bacteroidales bacterium]|nr:membrane protein insertion efficiency factor YidD [Bacteroidales bacterium]
MMKTKNFFLLCLCILSVYLSKSQSSEDIFLLSIHEFKDSKYDDRNVTYGFKETDSKNPVYHILSSGMFVYQKVLSPIVMRSCAYSPTCSGYSKNLIKHYGLIRGVIFTSDRLMRCNRVALAGKDMSFFDTKTMKHREDVFIYSFKNSKFENYEK